MKRKGTAKKISVRALRTRQAKGVDVFSFFIKGSDITAKIHAFLNELTLETRPGVVSHFGLIFMLLRCREAQRSRNVAVGTPGD